jgi:hypothetical protein
VFGVRWPLIAVLASGCATPGRTSVGVPDVGELTLDGTLQTQNILLLPHLDVEGSGAYSIGGSWNVELGLRGEIPLAARLALQIAAHWERAMWQAYQGDVYSYDATLLDDGGGDLGVVGRFGSASDAPSWGAFLSGADGLATDRNSGAVAHPLLLGAAGTFEFPLDSDPQWSAIAALAVRRPANSGDSVLRPFTIQLTTLTLFGGIQWRL